MAWEPGKFAAALKNASTSGRPVLMKVNYDDEHFTEDKNVTYANFAGQYLVMHYSDTVSFYPFHSTRH